MKYRIVYPNNIEQFRTLISKEIYKLGDLEEYGNFMVEGSPLVDAIRTGQLVLPENQGGTISILIETFEEI